MKIGPVCKREWVPGFPGSPWSGGQERNGEDNLRALTLSGGEVEKVVWSGLQLSGDAPHGLGTPHSEPKRVVEAKHKNIT